jgi:hypothetical protein
MGRLGETAAINMVLLRFGADDLVRCEEDGVIAGLKQLRKNDETVLSERTIVRDNYAPRGNSHVMISGIISSQWKA